MKNTDTILEGAAGDIVKCAGCGCETVLVGGFVKDAEGEWIKANIRPFHSCEGK